MENPFVKKIIKDLAEKHNLTNKQVWDIVKTQFTLIKKVMAKGDLEQVYLRNIGMFVANKKRGEKYILDREAFLKRIEKEDDPKRKDIL